MKPGSTVVLCASMTGVLRVARLRTSELLPTATKRPCFTANASARGIAVSCVRTRPFMRMKSGVSALPRAESREPSAESRRRGSVAAPARIALRLRNSPRVYVRIPYSAAFSPRERVRNARDADGSRRAVLLPRNYPHRPPVIRPAVRFVIDADSARAAEAFELEASQIHRLERIRIVGARR